MAAISVENKPVRDRLEARKKALDTERASFVPHWRDLSKFVLPRRGRFHTSDRNKGVPKDTMPPDKKNIPSKASRTRTIVTRRASVADPRLAPSPLPFPSFSFCFSLFPIKTPS